MDTMLPNIMVRRSSTGQDPMRRRVTFDAAMGKNLPSPSGSESTRDSSKSTRDSSKRDPSISSLSSPSAAMARQQSGPGTPSGRNMSRTSTGSRNNSKVVQRAGGKIARRYSAGDEKDNGGETTWTSLANDIGKDLLGSPRNPQNGGTEPAVVRKGERRATMPDTMRHAWVHNLARKHSLDPFEVKRILEDFDKVTTNKENILDFGSFKKAMCLIFGADVADKVVNQAWSASTMRRDLDTKVGLAHLDVDSFFSWYVCNMFTGVAALTACPLASRSQDTVYQIAKKHGVAVVTVDKVKRRFDKIDADGSGQIDYNEFKEMMRQSLRVPDGQDVSATLLQRCWQEIDADGSGSVDFTEFTSWYLKYFDPDAEDMTAPIQAFYNSYNPDQQRRGELVKGHMEGRYDCGFLGM